MFDEEKVKNAAIATILTEKESIEGLSRYVDQGFLEAVKWIHESKGRLVISGIGKSAIVAQKLCATFNSTGTPALFMHAADAIHGDLGMILQDDVVMVISKSGESPEIKMLMPLLKRFGNKVIALCGNATSYLTLSADIFVNTTVDKEACPNNLAPTSSTTAQIVMGDALAICLLELKGFTPQDFAKFHPGGALGKRLYLRVEDLIDSERKPIVSPESTLKEVILEMTGKRYGATVVMGAGKELLGIITDGDLRRMLQGEQHTKELRAEDIMTANPKKVEAQTMAIEALEQMRKHNISQLPVVQNGQYVGMLHVHDLIKEGLL